MKYLVSNYGLGVTVGLLEKEGANEDMNLAHNLFNSNVDHNLFNGSINFLSFKQFKRFLIYKEYFKICDDNKENKFKEYRFLHNAIKQARKTIDSNVRFANFMAQIRSNTGYYDMGGYADEPIEE